MWFVDFENYKPRQLIVVLYQWSYQIFLTLMILFLNLKKIQISSKIKCKFYDFSNRIIKYITKDSGAKVFVGIIINNEKTNMNFTKLIYIDVLKFFKI